MNSNQANALMEDALSRKALLQQNLSLIDGLKANGVDSGEAGERARNRAREYESVLLRKMKELIGAVDWINGEILDAASNLQMIEEAKRAMELTDSAIALLPASRTAEAGLVELTSLRSHLLGTIGLLATTLNPIDGRTIAADIGSHRTFPDGPDLFRTTDADAAGALSRNVDNARRAVAERGVDLVESEFEQLLG